MTTKRPQPEENDNEMVPRIVLPPEIWLEHVTPHLHVSDLIRLLAINREMKDVKAENLNDNDIKRTVQGDFERLITISKIEDLKKVPLAYAAAIDIFLHRTEEDGNSPCTPEVLEILRRACRVRLWNYQASELAEMKLTKSQHVDLCRINGLTDLSSIATVGSLKLIQCESVADVKALTKTPTVSLCYCRITDLSPLSNIQKLSVISQRNSDIRDVSPLRRLHTIELYGCRNVTDVTPLANVHTIMLSHVGVTDVTVLKGVNTLTLKHLSEVNDVSPLRGVHKLDLVYCPKIVDVAPLHQVFDLSLQWCQGVTDVSMLTRVCHLCLNGLKSVTDLSSLTTLSSLYLRDCQNCTDTSMLGSVKLTTIPTKVES